MATYRYIPMQYVTTAHNMGDHTPQPQQQHSTEHTQQQIQQQQQQVLPLHHLQQNLPPGVILTTNGGGGSSGGATTPSSSASGSFGGGRDGGLRNPPMGIWKKQLAERGCATCIHSKCCLSFLSMAGMVAHNKNCTGYAHEGDYVVCNVCGIKFKHYRSMQTHRVKSHYELNHSNSQPMPQGPFQGNPVAMQQQQQQQQPGARLNQAPKYEYPYALPPATTITPMHHNQQPMQIQQQQHQQQHPHYVQITTQPQESPTAGVGEVRYSFQGPSAPSGRNSKAPQQQLQYLPEQVVQNLQETPKPLDDEARALQNSRIMAESRLISTPRKRGRPAKNRGPVLMNHPHMPPPPPGYQYQTMPPICSSGINSSSYSSINVLSESSTSTSTTVPAGVMRLQPTPATMTQQQQQPNTGQIRLIPRTNSSSTPSLLVSSHSGATASVATPPAFPLSNHSSPSQTPGIRTGAASSSSVVAPTPPPSGSTTVNGVVIKRDLDLEAREKELADQEAKLLDYERLVLQSERLAEEARKVALDERERKMKQRQEELRKRLADAVQVLEDTKSIRIQQPSTSSSGGAVGSSDLDIPSRFSTPASSSAAEPTSTGQIMEGVDAYQESSTLDSSSIREDQLSTASENQILTPAQDVSSMTNINDDRPLDLPSSSPATIQASATPPRRKRVRILRPVIRHERGDQAPAGEPESILPDNPEEDQQPNPVRKQEEERQRSYSSSSNRDTDGAVSPPPAEDDSSQVISFVSPQTDNVSCDGVAQKSAESESTVKNCSGDENDGCKTAEKQKSSCDNDSTPNQTNDMDISVPKPEQKSRAKNPEADVPATPQPTVSSSSPEPQTPSTVDKRPIALGEITIEKISGPSSKPLTALKPLPNEEFGGRACRPLTTLTPQPLDTVINPLPPVAAPSLPPVSLIPVPKENEASEILKVLKPVDASTVPPSSCSGTDAGSTPPIVAKVLSLLPPKRAEPEPDNSSFTIIPPGFIKLEPQQQQLQQRVNVGPPLNSMEPVQNEVIIEYLDSDGKPTDAELVLDTWQASALEKSGQIVMDYVPTPSKAKSLPSHQALEPSTNIEHVEPEAEKTSELDSASASVDHVQVAVEPIKPSKPLLVQSEETASLMTDLTSGSRRDEDTSAVLEDSSLDQNPAVDCEGSSDTRDYPKPEEVTTSRHREAKLVPDPNDIEEQVTKHFEEDLATDNEVMDNSHDVSDGKSISDIINRLEDDDTGNESETKTDDASMPEKPCTEKERAPDKSDENDEVAVPPKKSSPAQPLKPYVLEVTKCSKLDDNAGEPKETSAKDLADSTAAADSANDALTCQPKLTESSSAKQPETKNKSPSYTHTIGTREMEITPARKSTRILRKPTLLAKKDKPAEDEQPAKENVISSSSKKDNVDVPLRRARKRKQTPTPMLELQDEVPEPIVQAPTSKKRKKRGSGKSAPVAEPDLICGKCDSSLKNQKLFSVHIAKVHCGLARLKGESQEFSKEERDEAIKAAFTEVKSVTCYKCDEKVFTTRTGLNYHLTTCGLTKDEIQELKRQCQYCNYRSFINNVTKHEERECSRRPELEKMRKQEEDLVDSMEVDTLTPSGRTRRRAAAKASAKVMEAISYLKKKQSGGEEDGDSEADIDGGKSDDDEEEFSAGKELDLKGKYSVVGKGKNQTFRCNFCSEESKKVKDIESHLVTTHSEEVQPDGDGDDEDGEFNDELIGEEEEEEDDDESTFGEEDAKYFENSPNRSRGGFGSRKSERPKPLEPAVDFLKLEYKFRQRNYEKNSFNDFHTTSGDWTILSEESASEYFPSLGQSLPFSTALNTAHKAFNPTPLPRFHGRSEGGTLSLFTGGPICTADWLHVPSKRADRINVLALTTDQSMDENHLISESPKVDKGLIQIWKCDSDFKEVKLSLAIAHNFGKVWCLKWCPSGNLSDSGSEDDLLPRLGLLAAACSDGCVRIFSIRTPESFSNAKSDSPIFCRVKPVRTLKLEMESETDSRCLKISWFRGANHRVIAGSYSSGELACWDILTPDTSLLRDGSHILPYQCITAHESSVTGLEFGIRGSPVNPDFPAEVATGSSDRTCSIWNLENPDRPLQRIRRGFVSDLSWLPHHHGHVALSFDDVFLQSHTHSLIFDFSSDKVQTHPVIAQNSAIFSQSYNPWLNVLLVTTAAGELIVFVAPPIDKALEYDKETKKRRTYVYRTEAHINKEHKEVEEGERSLDNTSPEADLCYSSVNKTAFRFVDMPTEVTDAPLDEIKRSWIPELMDMEDLTKYPIVALNQVCHNTNLHALGWIFSGGQAGIGRIQNVRSLRTPAINKAIKAIHP